MEFEKNNTKDETQIHVKVAKADVQNILNQTAVAINTANPIKGFRPGKAPYGMIVSRTGEETIIREALDDIVSFTLNKILQDESIRPYGNIDFDLKSISTPEWLLEYTAKFVAMPEVKLGDWHKNKIKKNAVLVPNEEIDKSMNELALMAATEKEVERKIQKKDKVIVDLQVMTDDKIIDDGDVKDFQITVGEGKMIPGFEDNLIGHVTGENFRFNLAFPADYGEKTLAGKSSLFNVTVKKVLEVVPANQDDEMAKRLGAPDLKTLKENLQDNLAREKMGQEEKRVENEAVKQIIKTAEFSDIPDKMIADSLADLMEDFNHSLKHQRVTMEQYLASTKKTIEAIKDDMKPAAIERIKTTLVLNKMAADEDLDVTDREIDQELSAERKYYAHDSRIMNDLGKPEYRNHLYRSLLNRKLMHLIKSKVVEG